MKAPESPSDPSGREKAKAENMKVPENPSDPSGREKAKAEKRKAPEKPSDHQNQITREEKPKAGDLRESG